MDKFERILEMPACFINREASARLAQRIYEIAEEQADVEYSQALRQIAPHLNMTPEQAITQYRQNQELRRVLVARRDRITFISPHGNVQYGGRDVLYDEIPMDPQQVIIDVPGIAGKYLNIALTTELTQVFPLHKGNKILIQGSEQGWVNGLYQEFETAVAGGKKVVRDFVYRWLRPLGFLGFFALSFLEFRLFQYARPSFTLLTPLSGLAIIVVFAFLLINQYAAFFLGGRAMQHLYPYFELEDRLSERRKDLRKFWIITVSALYGSGIWALISMLWGWN